MPAWWGRKSNSNRKKEEDPAPIKDRKSKEKPKSFDEIFARNSPNNRDSATGSAPGFDSDGVLEKRGLPLPRPTPLSGLSLVHDRGIVSGSVSSVSSSGSSEDQSDHALAGFYRSKYSDPTNTQRGRCLKPDSQRQQQIAENRHLVPSGPFVEYLKPSDIPASPRSEYQLNGSATPPNGTALCSPRSSVEIRFSPRSVSPGPVSRGHTLSPSALYPRACSFSPESSMEKLEDEKNQCHPLPLPPSSPSSPTSRALRNSGVNDNVQFQSLRSKWKKGGKMLGRGTFGHVYVGFNSESGQMCAIKEVRVISDDRNSKECLRQLNQEITLLSQLSHPNIVQYYGSELTEGALSVYLQYVSGGSIHKLLQEYGAFKEPVIQNYTAQILSGLAYLHGKNTVHRDIKGANILVDPNGEIKLADFGMAKHITSCTSVLSFKGSPYWMAPEVIMNFSGYNLAVDIWSLGCTIIEMATSKPPWSQYEGVAAIFKIGNSKDIPDIPDHLSEEGKSFLRLCLQRDPSARPTAAQLLEHPFVRDQATAKFAKTNIHSNRDTVQSSNDGTHMQNTIEFQSNRKNIPSLDGEYGMMRMNITSLDGEYGMMRNACGFPTTFNSSSNQIGTRMNLSLPVSPCSSPLRQFAAAPRSCFPSPPHPVYAAGMCGYGMTNHAVSPPGINKNLTAQLATNHSDPWQDTYQLRPQTPDGSPRVRHMQSWCS
ncbi:mitogen-activated protein kinase kinase kinase 3-like isoform X2 [Magnolia sinica]|uniref:mitogen-activated protein kinase kinase kinase 3-like isoform X2 n=1 Tax=Magnolia sinica TaxID=86752 RepID=UPI002659C5B6|nr:mitogen-activated protein kinase kinase kinase 3-like isoform X2 [Magnolia sinica]